MFDGGALSVPALRATAALGGSVLHQVFFKRFEIDKRPVSVAASFVGAYFGLALLLNRHSNTPGSPKRHGLLWALSVAFLTQSTFLVSLWANMLVYRGFFHPLRKFPGPFGAKFSKFWTLNQVLKSKIRWYQVVDKLQIGRNEGKPVIINDLSIHYSYYEMSALAFGEEMSFVTGKMDDAANEILQGIQTGVDAIGFLLHVPWLMTTLTTFSRVIGPMRKWNEWSKDQAERRKKMTNPKPDLFGHLYKNTPDTPKGHMLLYSEVRLIVGAGSDTTATALTNIFVNLVLYPEWQTKLREEVDEAFNSGTYVCSRSLPILDSIMNEVMRLYPSVFFPSQRETPPQGMMIGDRFIPGNTIISIPPYQIARDERNFIHATSSLPERWISRPDLIINKAAFMPFITGPHNCVGRNPAMMELRSVIARTVHEYDVRFPAGQEVVAEEFFSRTKDQFVAGHRGRKLFLRGGGVEMVGEY